MIRNRFFLALFLCVSVCCEAVSVKTREKMIDYLDGIVQVFDDKYAPAEFKKAQFDWTMEEALAEAKSSVIKDPDLDLKQFQRILAKLLGTTRDAHVSVSFFSTEAASLPFAVKSVDERYYVSAIEPSIRGVLNVGDEILSWDGRPVASIIQEFINDFGGGDSETNLASAENALTFREGASGELVPSGEVLIEISSKNGSVFIPLTWEYTPELITVPEHLARSAVACELKSSEKIYFSLIRNQKMILGRYAEYKAPIDSIHKLSGYRDSRIPNLGSIIWKTSSSNTFHAYIFKDSLGRKIGFLRIPIYMPEENSIKEYRKIIAQMQAQTEALIIDQMDNPGGYVIYCFSILASLTSHPLKLYQERLALTQSEVALAYQEIAKNSKFDLSNILLKKQLEDEFFGFSPDEAIPAFLNYYGTIINEWEQGHIFTRPMYPLGLKELPSHRACRYTKPILFLVNENSGSCGDLAPAILQDNGRARIMGRKTAGAGGRVESYGFPNSLGIRNINYTSSIAYRPDMQTLENFGVTPDVIYEKNVEDIILNNERFAEAILSEVNKLIH